MTLPYERTRAVIETRRFLRELMSSTPRVPTAVRDRARMLERHFPESFDLWLASTAVPDVFAPPDEATRPVDLPKAVAQEDRHELTDDEREALLAVLDQMPLPLRFNKRQWLEQWLDTPQPALAGESPREIAGRPDGFKSVQRALGAILSGAFL